MVLGALASCSIILSAAYSIYMLNRIVFGGSFFFNFFPSEKNGMIDLTKREFFILFILVLFTFILGIYPSIVLDGLHPSVSSLIFSENVDLITDAPQFKNSILPVAARNYSTLATPRRSVVKPQGDYKLDTMWVTGFSDGESCFHVSITPRKDCKSGWWVLPCLIIVLHEKDKAVLEAIQKFFGVGSITYQGPQLLQFRIYNKKDLASVIFHFKKFQLLTKKWADFVLWWKII